MARGEKKTLITFLVVLVLGSTSCSKASINPQPTAEMAHVSQWCAKIRKSIQSLQWKVEPCASIHWRVGGFSVKGDPLIYAQFGDSNAQNTTLVLSMVHGDEVTPLFLAMKLANWLKENESSLQGKKVVLAPLVNPDSFFQRKRTRVNANGVDINRNFSTSDWEKDAHRLWKAKFKSNPRRFPGKQAGSEPETIFQKELIKVTNPQKIMSIHAPLNFMDYDGPSLLTLQQFPKDYVKECMKLRSRLNAVSGGFFPGSLGNYAGRELGIPTLTLELPSANPRNALAYWNQFRTGIRTMIDFHVPDLASRTTQDPRGDDS